MLSTAVVAMSLVAQAATSAAHTQLAEEQVTLLKTRTSPGQELVYAVPESRLCTTVRWDPETQVPPLSIASAVSAAKEAGPAGAEYVITRIGLNASVCDTELRWYYTIGLYDRRQADAGRLPDMISYVILMDGSVVVPVAAKGPIR